ncbi:hypothetical protein QBC47DRAFT_392451 [Echria macrotheca]|uniref:Uncharacterized protein n=1 Tax=Echria macrotheca TaxID=438768 RepID=A0AAJ0B4S0_9PEZI|nr:hypothetical protein QBC47DRAFT_392451 [Echria macrotheca]
MTPRVEDQTTSGDQPPIPSKLPLQTPRPRSFPTHRLRALSHLMSLWPRANKRHSPSEVRQNTCHDAFEKALRRCSSDRCQGRTVWALAASRLCRKQMPDAGTGTGPGRHPILASIVRRGSDGKEKLLFRHNLSSPLAISALPLLQEIDMGTTFLARSGHGVGRCHWPASADDATPVASQTSQRQGERRWLLQRGKGNLPNPVPVTIPKSPGL